MTESSFSHVLLALAIYSGLMVCIGCEADPGNHGSPNPVTTAKQSQRENGNRGGESFRPCKAYTTIADIDCDAFPKERAPSDTQRMIYVSKDGSDGNSGASPEKAFRSIGKATQVAEAGSRIVVGAGTYREGEPDDYRALVLDKTGITIASRKGETVTVVPSGPDIKYGLQVNASDVVVDGIDLKGFTSALVTLESGIRDVILKNLELEAGNEDGVDGIVSADEGGMDGLLVRNVRVRKASLGISCNVGPCRNWWIDNTTVTGSGGSDDSGADAIASEVRNEDAPASEISSNWLITNVKISNAGGDGIDMKASRVAVFNADVRDNTRNGVKFWRGGDLVNSYVVNHAADAAIVFDRAGSYRILNSLIAYENFGKGPSYTMTVGYDRPDDPIDLAIVNTVFFNNSGSVHLSNGTKAEILHCFFGNTDTDELLVKGESRITETDSTSKIAEIAKSARNLPFESQPFFADPPRDFTFPRRSPLVDAGLKTEGIPEFDLRGQPRVKGKAPDLGPLEIF